ncbi:MAG: BNR-4 repeat-containing protein [Phycisphaeraceae bacterium]
MTYPRIPGYRAIWFDLGQRTEFGSKYSGALATYTSNHVPLAVYAPEVNKTFFVYGGTPAADERHLLCMLGCYDHNTGELPQPVVVHDKQGVDDPHDNPVLQIGPDGRLWVFVAGRGRTRPGFVYRGVEPYSIDNFELLREAEICYPQPWWGADGRLLLLLTKYTGVRELYWSVTSDGVTWSEDRKLAGMGGHYQVSDARGGRVITAFQMHPEGNVDRRTNLYFTQSDDVGETWRNVQGDVLDLPLTDPHGPALVRDYASEGLLVYLHDINFDAAGNPVVLYITSRDWRPGPSGDPRTWTVAHWRGDKWAFHEITTSTHNYDCGCIHVEADGTWRVIGPTETGPQHWGTGGEIAMWVSDDQGTTWRKTRQLTANSVYNHAYVRRPVNAHREFYGYWSDGDPDAFSPSRLHFVDQQGERVRRLPNEMTAAAQPPEVVDCSSDAQV